MRFWLLWAFFQIPVLLYGQKEAANWVLNFGTLKFDSLANITFSVLPKNVNGQGVNDNPLPVVSSCDGRILFFENSSSLQRTLTDSNINLIINGDSIGAGRWAPSIIEKISLNESLYMMFSGGPGSLPFGNLVYSRIEKSTTSDSFIVTQKNQIIDSLTGGFALTAHSNGVDKWLVAANRIAQKYSVYRIDSAGSITFHSSLFNSRLYHNQGASEEMTFSPDGRFLVTFGLPMTSTLDYYAYLIDQNPQGGNTVSVAGRYNSRGSYFAWHHLDGPQVLFKNADSQTLNLRQGRPEAEFVAQIDEKEAALPYPNPFSDYLKLTNNGEPAAMQITLHDVLGRLHHQQTFGTFDEKVIATNTLAAGMYTLTITTSHGKEQHKVVKH